MHHKFTMLSNTHSYKEWDEERKLEWLTEELTTKRPLIPAEMPMSDEVGGAGNPSAIWFSYHLPPKRA